MTNISIAPGWPGIPPNWTSSAKSGVGTALHRFSRVWFTLSHGIFDEIYYPRLDEACTRDMGFVVTDGVDFFSEEKRHAQHQVSPLEKGIPAFQVINTCNEGRYRIQKEILADPTRDVVLQHTQFSALKGSLKDYHIYVLLAPHIGNRGYENTAWVGDYKGIPMLFAERDGIALALACSAPWLKMSAGFVGSSDGWQDLNQHKMMTWSYDRAENGNVSLTGEIDLSASDGTFTLVLGFGSNPAEAGLRARASLSDGFEAAKSQYIREWQEWLKSMKSLDEEGSDPTGKELLKVSASVLRMHESKRIPGGLIASLSIPWGFDKGDDDMGGYHLAWPRDLAESAGGLLAAGAHADVRRVLYYLQSTQEADGHWPQNMWLDGRPYWGGIQMDETAFTLLLVDLARREKALLPNDLNRMWPMVKNAAGFLARNGPVTQQDRWEEDPGYSPFTLAVEIAGLLAAADLAELNQNPEMAAYLRETADAWNAGIERWIYATNTELAEQNGVEGYYVRVAPAEISDASSPAGGFVTIKNRPPGQSSTPAVHMVSPDALALVRFGLRAADDPRIVNTVKVIDALLKVETPSGTTWHRYNGDGYGEHEDGAPFDGTGIGRAWPLLTGERAHYELAAHHEKEALRLLHAMEGFSNEVGLLPEQVWDTKDIPDRELFFGKPSGSAMPLVWAHAEYVKLRRSLQDHRVFDMPPQTVQRYIVEKTGSKISPWSFNQKCRLISTGQILRIDLPSPAVVHWSFDGWQTTTDLKTKDTGLGIHSVDLPSDRLKPDTMLTFTFFWTDEDRWEGINYEVKITADA